jgi:tetratricopeptide (TPR) repeat protein
VSIASATQLAYIPNSSSNNVSNLSNALKNDIKTQNRAIEINPQNSTASSIKGTYLGLLGKSNEAINAFDKTIEISPQNSLAWYNKGNALTHLNKSAEAENAYNKATEINSQNSDA